MMQRESGFGGGWGHELVIPSVQEGEFRPPSLPSLPFIRLYGWNVSLALGKLYETW